jgi:hypothetical protein
MGRPNARFEFNYASINLLPYKNVQRSGNSLLKSILNKLNEEDIPSEKIIFDRHKEHKHSVPRQLVMISNSFGNKGQRCFGKIALIKNKNPKIWKGRDIIKEIEKEENGQFVDITNYIIHFLDNKDEAILMHEFNSEGPRLSDIEYYLRQVSQEFKIAKRINTTLHLDTNFADLEKQISNVFAFAVKVRSIDSNKHSWLKPLKNINDECGYRNLKLELLFKRNKDAGGKYAKNIKGLDLVRNLFSWLENDKKNLKLLEDLKMSYMQDGNNEIIDMDFLKNKAKSSLLVPFIDGRKYKLEDFRTIVGNELNFYLRTGKTNIQMD